MIGKPVIFLFGMFLASVTLAGGVASQLAMCKSEIKGLYGQETRVKMYKTKQFRGVTTLKLKVTPKGESARSVQCAVDVAVSDTVVLKDRDGAALIS